MTSPTSPQPLWNGNRMNFKGIQKLIKKKDYLFSDHADEEKTKDKLKIEEIEEAILSGEVIEERLEDPRGESRLIAGKSSAGKMIHIVVGLKLGKPVIVTNYIPSKVEWIGGIIRKRSQNE